MKQASFFLLSMLLHAAALTYPALFFGSAEKRAIPVEVRILEGGGEHGLTGKDRVEGGQSRTAGARRHAKPDRVGQPAADTEKTAGLENSISIPISSTDASDFLVAASEKSPAPAMAGFSSMQVGAEGGDGVGSGGWGNYGSGTGSGFGGGGGGKGPSFAQVSYAYSPKPQYPDRARSEGWEGTVVLRVLVDEEGKSKLLEINRSSGFEALDEAAMKTVKHWRFYPAHYGERQVESWVKIPIIFRLADLRD